MKAIRRSIKGDKDTRQVHHTSLTPKSALAIVPPKKVCALRLKPEDGHEGLLLDLGHQSPLRLQSGSQQHTRARFRKR